MPFCYIAQRGAGYSWGQWKKRRVYFFDKLWLLQWLHLKLVSWFWNIQWCFQLPWITFHVPLPTTDDLADGLCKPVLKILIDFATALNLGGLRIPLTFPNNKDCFDIFKVGAGPESCMASVGCDDLPQGTSLQYPSDMSQDDFPDYIKKLPKLFWRRCEG